MITLRAAPDSSAINLARPVSRPPSSWSTMDKGSTPSYKEVIEGTIESRVVEPDMPPLETVTDAYDPSYEPPGPQYEPEKREPNIFTDNAATNNPSGRGRGLICVTTFPPRGRRQNRRPFLGRGRSTEN